MYIRTWDDVPVGARVIEDTYNEVYEVIMHEGKKALKQVGWQLSWTTKPISDVIRIIDFDPNAPYDQPWIRLD